MRAHWDQTSYMISQSQPQNLRGKLLIAMPGMGDHRFDRSVVFLCEHNDQGAMGLIVNKPTPEIRFSDLLDQLELPSKTSAPDLAVHFGGPVENGRGFVLHSSDYSEDSSTMHVDETFGMTATMTVLQVISDGCGPRRALFALGYSGWGPGQLETELQQNGWLTVDADADIVFGEDNAGKWAAALKSLGVDPLSLSASAGRA